MSEFVKVEQDEFVATVTINRPDKLNALSAVVVHELTLVYESLMSASTPVRAAVLTGSGKAFVAGADIAEMAFMTPSQARAFAEKGHRLGQKIETAPFPTIAAVNGFALGGGCELALACDFIYASDRAKFGQPEVGLAVIPGFGGTQRLLRRVSVGIARELVYSGDIIDAQRAKAIGLVNEVFPGEELLAKAQAMAAKIATRGPLAVAAAKRVMLCGADASLAAGNEMEAQAFAALFGSEDQKAGMEAFMAKASASFKGQ